MLYLLLLTASCLSFHALAMEQKTTNNSKVDIRIFLKEQACNKKNAQGNTFLYQLARDCNAFNYWEEVTPFLAEYTNSHKGYVPNPFIEHEKIINNQATNITAKQEALNQFNDTGNPVCGTLKEMFNEMEVMFFDLAASKKGREQIATGTFSRNQKNR
jgi:hypothetical protein